MSTLKKTLVLGASSMLALSGIGGGFAVAIASADEPSDDALATDSVKDESYLKTSIVSEAEVNGRFAYTQNDVSSNADIKKNMAASQYFCGAEAIAQGAEVVAAEDWLLEVKGAVEHPYVASFAELAASDEVQSLLLGCACAGNPADGRAVANAEVTGIAVRTIIGMAEVSEGANTIVFTSADGYEVALPLSYVKQRYCPIVFDVNGAPLAESVGGTNQLWLGSTSANYFARDVVCITLEERQTPPPSPNSEEARQAYGNLPNIGVSLGGTIE